MAKIMSDLSSTKCLKYSDFHQNMNQSDHRRIQECRVREWSMVGALLGSGGASFFNDKTDQVGAKSYREGANTRILWEMGVESNIAGAAIDLPGGAGGRPGKGGKFLSFPLDPPMQLSQNVGFSVEWATAKNFFSSQS